MKNRVLIVPCAGASSRFPGLPPKYILKYPDGKYLIQKALEKLSSDDFSHVIFTILKEHVQKYHADKILSELFPNAEIVVLDEKTSCQSETVACTLLKAKKFDTPFVVKDCDSAFWTSIAKTTYPVYSDNFIGVLDILSENYRDMTLGDIAAKSLVFANNDKVTRIAEKELFKTEEFSKFISVGFYGFRSPDVFMKYFKCLMPIYKESETELFLSGIYNEMIRNDEFVGTNHVLEYEDFGTLNNLKKIYENAGVEFDC